jgi:hypothetical protein
MRVAVQSAANERKESSQIRKNCGV